MKIYLVICIIEDKGHLQKVFVAMEYKVNLEQNRILYLEDSMVMYGIYKLNTLAKLIDTMHKMHNKTTWNEKLFASKT